MIDPFFLTIYRSYETGAASFEDTLRFLQNRGITFEECCSLGFSPSFTRGLFPSIGPHTAPQKKEAASSFSFRAALPSDSAELERLAEAFLLDLNGVTTKDDLSGVDAFLLYTKDDALPHGALWHQEREDKSTELYVRALYTEPPLRGSGGGKALLQYVLEEFAPSQGFRSVGLDAPDTVVKFYQKLGFRLRRSATMDGIVFMSKAIVY